MTATTFNAPDPRRKLGQIVVDSRHGVGVDVPDNGTYTLYSSAIWYYSDTDDLAIGSMTAVAPGAEIELDGGDTIYMKAGSTLPVTVKIDFTPLEADTSATNAAASAAAASDSADEAATSADEAATSAALFPAAPGAGTFTLKSIDDEYTWVEDA